MSTAVVWPRRDLRPVREVAAAAAVAGAVDLDRDVPPCSTPRDDRVADEPLEREASSVARRAS